MNVLSVDLGGTRMKIGNVANGVLGAVHIIDTPDGVEHVLDAIAIAGAHVDGVGLCLGGLIDEHGVVVSLPGKLDGFQGVNVREMLEQRLNAPAVVVNDAVAYAMGESAFGAGRGFDRVVVMTIGTGVGVGVIEHGAPLTRGTVGGGIMGGFIPISERTDGPADSNGRADTIEALCAARRLTDDSPYGDAIELYAAHARGEALALTCVERYRANLARAVVALAHAHAPDAIVLGGGPMTMQNPVVGGLSDIVDARLFGSYRVALRVASLPDTAALLGLAHILETR